MKIKNNKNITDEELIDLSLVPVMGTINTQEQQIEKSVNLLLSIDLEKNKFLEDGDKKTAICDALGGKMSAIYDYGQRQKDEGIKEGIKKMAEYMIKEGKSNEEIHEETELPLEEIEKIRNNI